MPRPHRGPATSLVPRPTCETACGPGYEEHPTHPTQHRAGTRRGPGRGGVTDEGASCSTIPGPGEGRAAGNVMISVPESGAELQSLQLGSLDATPVDLDSSENERHPIIQGHHRKPVGEYENC